MCGCAWNFTTWETQRYSDVNRVQKIEFECSWVTISETFTYAWTFIFDMFHEVKKGYKLDSYSLNNVSKLYLGDQKLIWPQRRCLLDTSKVIRKVG